jgi:hypothetical protein
MGHEQLVQAVNNAIDILREEATRASSWAANDRLAGARDRSPIPTWKAKTL